MNVSSDMDAEGTLTINVQVPAENIDAMRKRGGHRALLRDRLLGKLDEAFTRWTQIDLGLLEHEDEEPVADGVESESPSNGEPPTEIQAGDWVLVSLHRGGYMSGELLKYSTEEVVLRDSSGHLVDVWPQVVAYVRQDKRPDPANDEDRGAPW